MDKPTIGFIGQGWIGKNYADNFEKRGFLVVRYSNELSYQQNKDLIKSCDITFIAVPTPTTPQGFDDSILREVLGIVGKGKIAVIKSTVVPGTTNKLQLEHPDIFVLNSPEFLSEKTVLFDVEHPDCNVVGVPIDTDVYRAKAKQVLDILPEAPRICCSSREAELIKYAHNVHGLLEIIYANILYDLGEKLGTNWTTMKEFMGYDRFMTDRYASPVHASGHTEDKGRGAGGHCFIKDFKAFKDFYEQTNPEPKTLAILKSLEEKNLDLLQSTGKDLDLLAEVYGDTLSQ